MKNKQAQLEALHDIRNLMQQSSRFLSLSGLSGVMAGTAALLGVSAAYWRFALWDMNAPFYQLATAPDGSRNLEFQRFMAIDLLLVLLLAIAGATWMSWRKARLSQQKIWNTSLRQMLWSMTIPMATGAGFGCVLWQDGLYAYLAPVSLLFYGLALVQASKHSLFELRQLGLAVTALGLAASIWPAAGLLLWGIGFGLLHLLYGLGVYFKYER